MEELLNVKSSERIEIIPSPSVGIRRLNVSLPMVDSFTYEGRIV
jgi:hypothetical protein